MILQPELFEKYHAEPLMFDAVVRKLARIPDDRYYTVSVWPVPGIVRVNPYLTRKTALRKISKST